MDIIQIFEHPEFGEIRVMESEGMPWFVGKDVAAALGYTGTNQALRKYVDDVDRKIYKSASFKTPRGMLIINKEGLYSLIHACNQSSAKSFKNWVESDVLPELQEHGNNVKSDVLQEKSLDSGFETDKCSHMPELVPIEREGLRVLLTSQLAEAYETTTQIISNNFKRNESRYQEGKHFFVLEGEAKLDFLKYHQIDDTLKYAPKLYLWTEKGALLHAKSLNTDKAWEIYDYLVETYFRMKETSRFNASALSPSLQMAKTFSETVNALSKAINTLVESMTRTELEQKR